MDKENENKGKMTDSPIPHSELRVPRSEDTLPRSAFRAPRSKVLIVDDEKSLRLSLQEFLKDADYEVGVGGRRRGARGNDILHA